MVRNYGIFEPESMLRISVLTCIMTFVLIFGMSVYTVSEFGSYSEAMEAKTEWMEDHPNCSGLETWSDGIEMMFS